MTRPFVLWLAGVALVLLVFPLILYDGRLYYAEGGQSPDAPGMLLLSLVMTSPIWIGGWLLLMALFLVGYRGGARLLPVFGKSVLAGILAVLSFAFSALFVWWAFARIDFWLASRLPFMAELLAAAGYWQLLRAAAVSRSMKT